MAAKSKSEWRKCEGVNKNTGRIKSGFKATKGGGCPTPVNGKSASKKKSAKDWRKCEGVNKRTGRTKPGFKVVKGGGCPVKTGSAKASSYYTGSSYGAGYEAWKKSQDVRNAPGMPWFSAWGPKGGVNGLRGVNRRRKARRSRRSR